MAGKTPVGKKIQKRIDDAKANGGYITDYREPDFQIPEPIFEYPPGSILPHDDLPDHPECPFCGYQTTHILPLRGHAWYKHGIRWMTRDPNEEPKWMTTLKPWHYTAFALRELYGLSWKDVGARVNRDPKNLRRAYERSPAAKEFRNKIREIMSDPEAMVRMLFKANSVNATADYLMALEWAKDAKDYRSVREFTKDLLNMDEAVIGKGTGNATPQNIHIHLDAGDLEAPKVRTSYEEVTVEGDWTDDTDSES